MSSFVYIFPIHAILVLLRLGKAMAGCYNLQVSIRSGRIVWPSARDWKSRTGVKVGRGFESHPLRWHPSY